MFFDAILKSEDENINEIFTAFEALKQDGKTLTDREFENNVSVSRKVFGLMMRGNYQGNKKNKFQPCQDELDLLKEMKSARPLCFDLRHRTSLTQFCHILLPGEWVQDRDGFIYDENYIAPVHYLKNNDSIFHIDQNIANDKKEFIDLEKRANRIALEIEKNPQTLREGHTLDVQILDGHGRMIVLLMKALELKNINLDSIKFKVFEINEVVHEFHKYVFNERIEIVKRCIINQSPRPRNAMIYLNFCSIKSATEFDWTAHFKEQNIKDYELACVKENVLRFIARSTGRPYNCTVMISFVIKHNHEPFEYQVEFSKTLGDHLTGLGLLYVLLNDFNAEIVSIRPEYEIEWHDSKIRRIPKKLRSGGKGCPFVSLLVKPGDYNRNLGQRFFEGCPPSSNFIEDELIILDRTERKIADLKENIIQKNARVEITSGLNIGRVGTVISRTAAKAHVELDDKSIINPNLQQMKVLGMGNYY